MGRGFELHRPHSRNRALLRISQISIQKDGRGKVMLLKIKAWLLVHTESNIYVILLRTIGKPIFIVLLGIALITLYLSV